MSRSDDTRKVDFTDPVNENRAFHIKESKIAVAGHPIHAMLVAFPIALTMSVLGADLFYWWTGSAFWASVAGWAAFGAFVMAVLAAITGTVELLMVSGIRNRAASWTHFILAMTLIAILGLNWMIRIDAAETAVLPLGLALSFLAAGMTAMTGWHGGKLVFDYQMGTKDDGNSRPSG